MTNVSPMAVAMMQADLYRRHALHRGAAAVATITTTYQGYRRAHEKVVYTDTESTVLDIDSEVPFGVHPSWIDMFDSWGASAGTQSVVTVSLDYPTTWHVQASGSSLEIPKIRELVEGLAKSVKAEFDEKLADAELSDEEFLIVYVTNDHRSVRFVRGAQQPVSIEVDIDIERFSFDDVFADRPDRRITVTIGARSLSYSIGEIGFPTERVTLR